MRLAALFTEERVARVARFMTLGYLVAAIVMFATAQNLVYPTGRAVGADFVTFWAASDLALAGQPEKAYDEAAIRAAEKRALPQSNDIYLWHYPPVFQLVVLPLALLPYLWSYAAWVLLSLAVYAVAFRGALHEPAPFWLAISASGVYVNVLHGQNGLLSAALVCGGLLLLERRPVLAGILIGLLCYKPHIGLPLGILLLVGGHWRAAAGAIAAVIAFCAASALALGTEVWSAFLANATTARAVLETGAVSWDKMASVFAAVRMLGGGLTLAYALHAIVALVVLALTAQAWRSAGSLELKAAIGSLALLLVSPYLFDYDLAIAALPLALLLADGFRNGWIAGMRPMLVVVWLTPAIAPYLADLTRLQLQPLALLILWWLAWRRMRVAR